MVRVKNVYAVHSACVQVRCASHNSAIAFDAARDAFSVGVNLASLMRCDPGAGSAGRPHAVTSAMGSTASQFTESCSFVRHFTRCSRCSGNTRITIRKQSELPCIGLPVSYLASFFAHATKTSAQYTKPAQIQDAVRCDGVAASLRRSDSGGSTMRGK